MTTTSEALTTALNWHRAGNYGQAETLYRQILQTDPAHADVWCCLGMACRAQGRLDEAAASYRRALQLNPNSAESHNNLANVYFDQGNLDEALACYRQALQLKPDYVDAQLHLGVVHRKQGRFAEAVDCCRRALQLNPQSAEAHLHLGNALLDHGERDEGVAHLRQAVALRPNYQEAVQSLEKVLAQLESAGGAGGDARPARKPRADPAIAHLQLGDAFFNRQQWPEALQHYQQAVRCKPDLAKAHNNVGATFLRLRRLEEAVACFQKAIELDPDYGHAYFNLGCALVQLVRLPEAVAAYDQAIRLGGEVAPAHMGRALTCLLLGDFEQGWSEFEWRSQCPECGVRQNPQPQWRGEPLEGKTILLQAEQGLGDTLQLIRYAPLVRARGSRVVFECPPGLIHLLNGFPGIDRMVSQGATLPPFDVYAPLMSLPGAFRTTLETIPADVPYLFADPGLVARWRQELDALPGFKVGICWQGSRFHKADAQRSVPLAQFVPLARVTGARLISLQKGDGVDQLAAWDASEPLLDLGNRLVDPNGPFTDTAAVLRCLDLVVTVDTALAHLAGAMGVPVWVALPFLPDWRWLLERTDSPWYPTMRLFRQTALDQWEPVFQAMADELKNRSARMASRRPLLVEITPSELLDQITILELESEHLSHPAEAGRVRRELAALQAIRKRRLRDSAELLPLVAELKEVNLLRRQGSEDLRQHEREGHFEPPYVELARSVVKANDRRDALKRRIDELLGGGPQP